MAEKAIDEQNHVLRFCPRNRTIREGNVVVGVHPTLFALRVDISETYLSASFVEFFDGAPDEQIKAAADATPLTVGKDDYFLKLNVGAVKALGIKHKLPVKVTHVDNNKRNPAYAKIKGTPPDASHQWIAEMADAFGGNLIKAP
ncbi:hypothetical protein GR217_13050 [Rhizobium leguminosarum]|uniref:Uncharacterized protein n=1 Tax=Rhizobium ruizarguesonis TaxID=2081791 RepID=A0AAE4YPA2_9HYPH|nr:hypothetical protein [Rhizobium ruizarguesonis]NEI48625.1 hypothetical protein [Rhizobium ruizarguesonis]